jgi:seryl-tRNA synthetase
MHDIKYIRDNPKAFDAALKRLGVAPEARNILALDEAWREAVGLIQAAKEKKNKISKEIGIAKSKGEDAKELLEDAERIGAIAEGTIAMEKKRRADLYNLMANVPNLPHDSVPDGENENDNPVLRKEGKKPDFKFKPKEHFDLGEALGLMDFETAAKISGARFTILNRDLARLERALGQFMIDLALEHGYEEVSTPSLVLYKALYGTGQLPKFADDLFQTEDNLWMIPTAEVTLSNIHRESILAEEDLPIRYAALTPCYRAEAGSAGKDTRGMIRQHQFAKVELVTITTPENSLGELERKTKAAEEVLKRLKLPYRVVELCTGDLGFSARKTYDIEVWLPGQGRYREISSCSDCGDFQARRMNMRCRKKDQKHTRFPHTLNGSALAVGRCLVAVMENYQQADGSITVPGILSPYMGGLKKIAKA